MYVSGYQSNLFSSGSNSTSSLYSLFAGSSYYKTVSKYAINSKYGHNSSSQQTSASQNKTSAADKKAETQKATKFLTDYTDSYKSLKETSNKLKSTLSDSDSTVSAKVDAAQKYVDSYNNTLKFLSENSSDNTYSLNILKKSLNNIDPSNYAITEGTGISKNKDGSLSLDTKALTSSLTKDSAAVTRKLTSLANVTSAHTNISSNVSKATLLKEQSMIKTSSTQSDDDESYKKFLKMAKNPTALNNYYYNLGAAGIFMDISI